MSTRLATLLVAAVVLAAVGGGCGSSDDSTSTSAPATSDTPATTPAPVATSSLSKAAVIKKASAACQQTREGLAQEEEAFLEKHASEEVPQDELLANVTKEVLLPKVEAEIETIRNVGAPAGDEKEIERILAAQQTAVGKVAGLKAIDANGDLEAPFAKANKMRQSYGLGVCRYVP